ncbi:MAG: L,D-transpeptidase, partial [Candidatus Omnitrophota bacterium]
LLKSDEEIMKTYIVSTGKNNSTPVGNFKITSKLINPTWFKAGAVIPAGSPKNILGTRWLGLDRPSYGIHGTTEPQSLGRQATQGCVRMTNQDVEELYIIVPIGTEVIIVD